jgi:hypothetical protein
VSRILGHNWQPVVPGVLDPDTDQTPPLKASCMLRLLLIGFMMSSILNL